MSWTGKIKVLGATNQRTFVYKKAHNDFKLVTSQKAISQIEYGHFRIPIWLWILVIGSFFISLSSLFGSPDFFDIISFIPTCGALIITIIYRKFDFINTSVGCEPFRVLSIRKSVLKDIEQFINILHSKPANFRNTSERFVQSNYFQKLFTRLLGIISVLYSPFPFYFDLILSSL